MASLAVDHLQIARVQQSRHALCMIAFGSFYHGHLPGLSHRHFIRIQNDPRQPGIALQSEPCTSGCMKSQSLISMYGVVENVASFMRLQSRCHALGFNNSCHLVHT